MFGIPTVGWLQTVRPWGAGLEFGAIVRVPRGRLKSFANAANHANPDVLV